MYENRNKIGNMGGETLVDSEGNINKTVEITGLRVERSVLPYTAATAVPKRNNL